MAQAGVTIRFDLVPRGPLPYGNGTCDRILVCGLTHARLPADLERLFGDVFRLLRPRARCMVVVRPEGVATVMTHLRGAGFDETAMEALGPTSRLASVIARRA